MVKICQDATDFNRFNVDLLDLLDLLLFCSTSQALLDGS